VADFLAEMAAASHVRCERAMQIVPPDEMRRLALSRDLPVPIAVRPFLLIAEVKLASPSEGVLRAIPSATSGEASPATQSPRDTATLDEVVKQARLYEANEAGLISVLAEPLRFGGDLTHVARAAAAVRTPVMRKDFVVSPYQIYESRAVGASAVLLIVRMLSDETLRHMLIAAAECGLLVILEVFNHADVARARKLMDRHPGSPQLCIGVNTRDLSTLQVDPLRLEQLSPLIDSDVPWVAESGLQTPGDVTRAVERGYCGALIGSALMKSSDPALLCRQMALAGQTAAVNRLVAHKQAARARRDEPEAKP